MSNLFLTIGAATTGLGVAMGAFGAHALKSRLSEPFLHTFTTGVHYHLIHALGLCIVGLAIAQSERQGYTVAGWLMLAGILLFSGSLYALSLSGLRWLGAITPIGGVCWIVAWTVLAATAWSSR